MHLGSWQEQAFDCFTMQGALGILQIRMELYILQWCHYEHHGVFSHWHFDGLFNILFRLIIKWKSKHCITGPLQGVSPSFHMMPSSYNEMNKMPRKFYDLYQKKYIIEITPKNSAIELWMTHTLIYLLIEIWNSLHDPERINQFLWKNVFFCIFCFAFQNEILLILAYI